jgi:hypothetical protein
MTGECINESDTLVIHISVVWYRMYYTCMTLCFTIHVSSFMKIRISDTVQENLLTLKKNMLKSCGQVCN